MILYTCIYVEHTLWRKTCEKVNSAYKVINTLTIYCIASQGTMHCSQSLLVLLSPSDTSTTSSWYPNITIRYVHNIIIQYSSI